MLRHVAFVFSLLFVVAFLGLLVTSYVHPYSVIGWDWFALVVRGRCPHRLACRYVTGHCVFVVACGGGCGVAGAVGRGVLAWASGATPAACGICCDVTFTVILIGGGVGLGPPLLLTM